MSTSLRSSPDTREMFLPSVEPLSLTTFVPGAILRAAELNGSFASVLPLTGGAITPGGVLLDYRLSQPGTSDPNAPNSGLLVRWTNTSTPGPLPPVNVVSAPVNVVASDYAGSITSIWGVSVSMTVNSTMFGTSGVGPWPQHVGGSFTISKSGNCYAVGVHTSPRETSNNPSSLTGPLHGIELSHQANNDDDAGNPGFPGIRFGIHMAQASNIASGSGGVPAVFAIGYNHGNSGGAITKSIFCALDSVAYQVLDARRTTAPPGYTDPVAAVRMAGGQIIDFHGATTNNNTPGWVGAAGSYLQYYANSRLRYVSGGNEIFSLRDDGLTQLNGELFITASPGQPSIVMLIEQWISFNNAGNRTMMLTAVGGPQRLAYQSSGVDLFSIADSGRIALGVLPTNAANDAAAATAGVPVGGVYRNASVLMIRAA